MSLRLDYVGAKKEDINDVQTAIDTAMPTAKLESIQREETAASTQISVFVPDETSATDVAACDAVMTSRGFERIE